MIKNVVESWSFSKKENLLSYIFTYTYEQASNLQINSRILITVIKSILDVNISQFCQIYLQWTKEFNILCQNGYIKLLKIQPLKMDEIELIYQIEAK